MFHGEFTKWRKENDMICFDERYAFSEFIEARRRDSEDIVEEIAWQLFLMQRQNTDKYEDCY
jgi:hypothetical protein